MALALRVEGFNRTLSRSSNCDLRQFCCTGWRHDHACKPLLKVWSVQDVCGLCTRMHPAVKCAWMVFRSGMQSKFRVFWTGSGSTGFKLQVGHVHCIGWRPLRTAQPCLENFRPCFHVKPSCKAGLFEFSEAIQLTFHGMQSLLIIL